MSRVLSRVSHFAIPPSAACQGPCVHGILQAGSCVHGILQAKYRSGLPFPTPGNLPYPGIEPTPPVSPALQANSLPTKLSAPPRIKKKQPEHRMITENRKDETLVKRGGLTMGRITHRRQKVFLLQNEGSEGRIFHMISLLLRISTSSLVERSKPHLKQKDLIRSYFSNQEECAEGPGLRR